LVRTDGSRYADKRAHDEPQSKEISGTAGVTGAGRAAGWQAVGHEGASPSDTAPEWELFDEKDDPREMHNLYRDPKYSHIVEELKRELDVLQRQAVDKPS
jgi:hypothetical protein